jgi:hypothetical protein
MLGSTLQDLPSDSPAACRSACRRRRASQRTGSHQRTILACTRPSLVGHAVELATAQPPPDDDGQVQTDASAGPAAPAPASRRGADSGRRRAGHGRSGRPRRPRHPSHTAACPRRAPRPHSHRTPRTPRRTDTRHRTPDTDTWTLKRPHRTPATWTGTRRTPDARTGHWTADAGHERGHGDDSTAGIRRSAAPRRIAVLGRLRVERRANGDASSVMAIGVAARTQGWLRVPREGLWGAGGIGCGA